MNAGAIKRQVIAGSVAANQEEMFFCDGVEDCACHRRTIVVFIAPDAFCYA